MTDQLLRFFKRETQKAVFAARSALLYTRSRLHADKSEIGRNRSRIMKFAVYANLREILVTGNFLTGLLLYMKASDSFIGLVAMSITAANMFQILSPLLLCRFKRRKRAYLVLRGVFLFFKVVFVALIPLFPMQAQAQLILFCLVTLLCNILGALHFPGISTWHMQFLPQEARASFFSTRTIWIGVVTALASVGAGRLLDLFAAAGREYLGILAVRAIALLAVCIEFAYLIRTKDETAADDMCAMSLKALFVIPFKETSYLRTSVLAAFLWSSIANLPGAFYAVYLLSDVKVSYTFINIVSLVNIPILVVFTPFWAKVVRKLNWLSCLCIAMGLYALHFLMLPFVTASSLWLYPVSQVFAYVMIAGVNLAFTGIPYVNIPKENQTLFIGFYSTVANIGAFLGTTLGRYIINNTAGITLKLFGLSMVNKQYYIFAVFMLMAVFTFVIYFMQKGAAQRDG